MINCVVCFKIAFQSACWRQSPFEESVSSKKSLIYTEYKELNHTANMDFDKLFPRNGLNRRNQ